MFYGYFFAITAVHVHTFTNHDDLFYHQNRHAITAPQTSDLRIPTEIHHSGVSVTGESSKAWFLDFQCALWFEDMFLGIKYTVAQVQPEISE